MADETSLAGYIVAAITAGGGVGFVANLIASRAKAKRDGVEGSAVLINSASAYAKQLTDDNVKLRAEFAALRLEMYDYRTAQERREREQDRRFREHTRWDDAVRQRLSQVGETVPPPPPLYLET